MRTLFYSTKDFERETLRAANRGTLEHHFITTPLGTSTTALAAGFDAVCIFTGDDASAPVISGLKAAGVRFIAVRAAGTDNVDLAAATAAGIRVANVPGYSPHAIAEHAVALLLAMNRKLVEAHTRVLNYDFRVDGLVGFDLYGKTVGIIGTGRIGAAFARIMHGFGCRLLATDPVPDFSLVSQLGLEYVSLEKLCTESDVISIHTGLTSSTRHLINADSVRLFRKGIFLINTGRGGCVNTEAVLEGIADGKIAAYGADVYEYERGLFFYDHSGAPVADELLKKLLTSPQVLLTPHQAFATREALEGIATITQENISAWAAGKVCGNELNPVSSPKTETV